jgi:apolipoprotein N-acyltransferase
LWPATLLGVGALIWLTRRMPSARWAGAVGWLWGVGHFSAGNSWIATAFTYQAKMPQGWAVWRWCCFRSIWRCFRPWRRRGLVFRAGGARVPGFAGLWIVTEWLRSWLFTGFAWNPLGVALLGDDLHPGLAFLAPWLGTYGLSGLMAGLAAVADGRAGSCRGAAGTGAALVAVPVVLLGGA